MRINKHAIAVFIFVSIFSAFAFAQEVDNNGDHEWSWGVSQEERKIASEFGFRGNDAFNDGLFRKSRDLYLEAIKHWDNPVMRNMLATIYYNLGQPEEAHRQILISIKYGGYGDDPADKVRYIKALRFKKMLEQQLAHVKIRCLGLELQGAEIFMDGKKVLTAPGEYEVWVRAGPHSVVASKTDYLTREENRELDGGSGPSNEFDMKLITLEQATEKRRRWPDAVRKNWALFAGGLAFGAAGGILHYEGRRLVSQYEKGIGSRCGEDGCFEKQNDLSSKRTRGKAFQRAAYVSYAIGGTGLAISGIIFYLNRQRPYPKANPYNLKTESRSSVIIPYFDGNNAGFMAAYNF